MPGLFSGLSDGIHEAFLAVPFQHCISPAAARLLNVRRQPRFPGTASGLYGRGQSMQRLKRASAAAAMAIAVASGGLLITAAGAVPAYASPPAPPSPPPGGHVVASITFERADLAASGVRPHTILPCAVHKPAAAGGATPADDTCESGIITCDVTAFDPSLFSQ